MNTVNEVIAHNSGNTKKIVIIKKVAVKAATDAGFSVAFFIQSNMIAYGTHSSYNNRDECEKIMMNALKENNLV